MWYCLLFFIMLQNEIWDCFLFLFFQRLYKVTHTTKSTLNARKLYVSNRGQSFGSHPKKNYEQYLLYTLQWVSGTSSSHAHHLSFISMVTWWQLQYGVAIAASLFAARGAGLFWQLRRRNGFVTLKTFFFSNIRSYLFDYIGCVLRESATLAVSSSFPSSELNDNSLRRLMYSFLLLLFRWRSFSLLCMCLRDCISSVFNLHCHANVYMGGRAWHRPRCLDGQGTK